jgi:hypothetical protein
MARADNEAAIVAKYRAMPRFKQAWEIISPDPQRRTECEYDLVRALLTIPVAAGLDRDKPAESKRKLLQDAKKLRAAIPAVLWNTKLIEGLKREAKFVEKYADSIVVGKGKPRRSRARERVLAFVKYHFGDKVPHIPFRLILVPINLVTDAKALIEEIKYELRNEPPSAVVIDTLARAMPGRSESKDEDMGAFIKAADLIYRAFDCFVPIVHHSGWTGDHSRGHSSLPAAVDIEISIRNSDRGDIIAKIERAINE